MGISENADSPLLCSREIKLMQYPKDDIQKEILKAAEKVFLENGFPKASMREIAQEAQVGLSNIYNYFKNKDDIFCTVVRPVISAFDRMLHEHHGRYGADIMEMYSSEYLRCVIEEYMTLIQKHRKLLVLLFFHAQGSSLENFKENFTERSTSLVKEYFRDMKEKYPQMSINVTDFSIHLHTAWMFTMFEELIMHRVGTENLEQIVTEYITFEVTGWRELMKYKLSLFLNESEYCSFLKV